MPRPMQPYPDPHESEDGMDSSIEREREREEDVLDLSGRDLPGVSGLDSEAYRSVSDLNLADNCISKVSFPLPLRLEVLDLSHNLLSPSFSVPHTMANLLSLDLSHNRIRSITPLTKCS
ncbi:hypothetical protein KIPB_012391, partial [Kipferlia bialata]|eukprot:g12391.t1